MPQQGWPFHWTPGPMPPAARWRSFWSWWKSDISCVARLKWWSRRPWTVNPSTSFSLRSSNMAGKSHGSIQWRLTDQLGKSSRNGECSSTPCFITRGWDSGWDILRPHLAPNLNKYPTHTLLVGCKEYLQCSWCPRLLIPAPRLLKSWSDFHFFIGPHFRGHMAIWRTPRLLFAEKIGQVVCILKRLTMLCKHLKNMDPTHPT